MLRPLYGCLRADLIIQIQRFSKNLLGDEGYLMFTLPASVSQHITAKLVVAVLLDVLSVAAAILRCWPWPWTAPCGSTCPVIFLT